MAENPISGHTAGTNDGLRDGDHILSPSLTNIYEGLHGNGILNPHDTAFGSGDRNNIANLPGAVTNSSNHILSIKSFQSILDGVLYNIDDGSGGATLNLTLATGSSDLLTGTSVTALTSGQETIFAILAVGGLDDGSAKFVQGSIVTTGVGNYPSLSGSSVDAYLKMNGVGAAANKQTMVIATVRATFNGSPAAGNNLNLTISEINDKRVFIRPSPFYLSPVTTGSPGDSDHLNSHTALAQIHGSGEHGNFGNNGVLWMSYNQDDNAPNLYFSEADANGSNRHTHLLGPSRIKALTASRAFEFDDAQVFTFTGASAKNLTPTGTFPPGHTVIATVLSGGVVTFDPSGLNTALTASDAVMFVYNGSAWVKVIHSGTSSSSSSGGTGLVQLSDGSGGYTSDAKLFWTTASSTLTVNGKLTVTGLIDPTGLVIDEKADVAATGHTTAAGKGLVWVKNDAPNRLYFTDDAGTDKKVLHATDSVTELSDVTAVGSGSIISGAERTKLTNIETAADVTVATNVNAAIAGHTYTAATVAANDKILIQDTDGSNAVKTVTASSIAALGGGGGGGGSSIADADNDTKIDVETSSDDDKIIMTSGGTDLVQVEKGAFLPNAVKLLNATALTFHATDAASNSLTITCPTGEMAAANQGKSISINQGTTAGDTILTAAGFAASANSAGGLGAAPTLQLGAAGNIGGGVFEIAKLHAFTLQSTIFTANRTGTLNDTGQYIIMTGSGLTYTLVANASLGAQLTILAGSTNAVTVTATGNKTINGGAANGSITVAGYNGVTLICIDASNNWLALGV